MAASVALRDLNVDVPATDGRRIEVVANGLPLWRGAQIAVDTPLVSPLQRCGEPRPGADVEPGCALRHAEARKHRTYPELRAGGQGRCRLVVFGMEVGGRFSPNALAFIRRLARTRGRARAPWNAAAAGRALTRRWHCLASLAALRAHAQALLELPVQSCDAGDDQELPPLTVAPTLEPRTAGAKRSEKKKSTAAHAFSVDAATLLVRRVATSNSTRSPRRKFVVPLSPAEVRASNKHAWCKLLPELRHGRARCQTNRGAVAGQGQRCPHGRSHGLATVHARAVVCVKRGSLVAERRTKIAAKPPVCPPPNICAQCCDAGRSVGRPRRQGCVCFLPRFEPMPQRSESAWVAVSRVPWTRLAAHEPGGAEGLSFASLSHPHSGRPSNDLDAPVVLACDLDSEVAEQHIGDDIAADAGGSQFHRRPAAACARACLA